MTSRRRIRSPPSRAVGGDTFVHGTRWLTSGGPDVAEILHLRAKEIRLSTGRSGDGSRPPAEAQRRGQGTPDGWCRSDVRNRRSARAIPAPSALKNHQLLPEGQVLKRQTPPTPQRRYDAPCRVPDPIPHRRPLAPRTERPSNLRPDEVFATHRGVVGVTQNAPVQATTTRRRSAPAPAGAPRWGVRRGATPPEGSRPRAG